jgi:hypothetical protein
MIEFIVTMIWEFFFLTFGVYPFAFILWLYRKIVNKPLTFKECIKKIQF